MFKIFDSMLKYKRQNIKFSLSYATVSDVIMITYANGVDEANKCFFLILQKSQELK